MDYLIFQKLMDEYDSEVKKVNRGPRKPVGLSTVRRSSCVTDKPPRAYKEMAAAAQNINNATIKSRRNLLPIGPALDPKTADPDTIDKYYETVNLEQEVACLMLLDEVKQKLFETVKAIYACKQEDGQSVSSYLLKMKSYLDTLERLGYVMSNELGVSLILNSINKKYDQFVQNYNMHSMRKTLAELHVMLKLHEKGIPKKAKTLVVLAIREGKIQKDKKKQQGAKGYTLESAARILNMVPTKKVERTPYEIWHGKAPKLSYLRVWGCYPKETMGYYFYYPLENKIFVARNDEFFENNLIVQEASGSHELLKLSGSGEGLELIQEEDTQPSENTSEEHKDVYVWYSQAVILCVEV
uniref:Zinc finger, CCHC-type n=1 Tax=Tanacetum cinerariifolium TaxID=118510 RepID=A0A6L2J6R7_TANCI|nr:hypothetical protein [Tanacetum cinerariifolium]